MELRVEPPESLLHRVTAREALHPDVGRWTSVAVVHVAQFKMQKSKRKSSRRCAARLAFRIVHFYIIQIYLPLFFSDLCLALQACCFKLMHERSFFGVYGFLNLLKLLLLPIERDLCTFKVARCRFKLLLCFLPRRFKLSLFSLVRRKQFGVVGRKLLQVALQRHDILRMKLKKMLCFAEFLL